MVLLLLFKNLKQKNQLIKAGFFVDFSLFQLNYYSPPSVHSKLALSTEQRAFFNTDIIPAS